MATAKVPQTMEEKLQELTQGMLRMDAYIKKLEQQIHDTEVNSLQASQQSQKSATEAAQSQALASTISQQVVETLAKPRPYDQQPSKLQHYRQGSFKLWADRFEGAYRNDNYRQRKTSASSEGEPRDPSPRKSVQYINSFYF